MSRLFYRDADKAKIIIIISIIIMIFFVTPFIQADFHKLLYIRAYFVHR